MLKNIYLLNNSQVEGVPYSLPASPDTRGMVSTIQQIQKEVQYCRVVELADTPPCLGGGELSNKDRI